MADSIAEAVVGPISELLNHLVILAEDSADDQMSDDMCTKVPMVIQTAGAFIQVVDSMRQQSGDDEELAVGLQKSKDRCEQGVVVMNSALSNRSLKELIQGVLEILESARLALAEYDAAILRRVFYMINKSEEQTKICLESKQWSTLVSDCTETTKTHSNMLTHTRDREKEILSIPLRTELMDTEAQVERVSPRLIAAAREVVSSEGSASANELIQSIGNQLYMLFEKLREILSKKNVFETGISDDGNLFVMMETTQQKLQGLVANVRKATAVTVAAGRSPGKIDKLEHQSLVVQALDFQKRAVILADAAAEIVGMISDEQEAKEVREAIKVMRKTAPDLVSAIKKNKDVDGKAESAMQAMDTMTTLVAQALEGGVQAALEEFMEELCAMGRATENHDEKDLNARVENIVRLMRVLTDRAHTRARVSGDPGALQRVTAATAMIKELAHTAASAARVVCRREGGTDATENFVASVADLKACLRNVTGAFIGNQTSAEALTASFAQLEALGRRFRVAVKKKNIEEASRAARAAASRVEHQAAILRSEAEVVDSSDEVYKGQLSHGAEELDKAAGGMREVVGKTGGFEGEPDTSKPAENMKQVEGAMTNLLTVADKSARCMRGFGIKKGKGRLLDSIDMGEVGEGYYSGDGDATYAPVGTSESKSPPVKRTSKPFPRNEEMYAAGDIIKNAAANLKRVAARYRPRREDDGVRACLDAIVGKMHDVGDQAKLNNKKGLIQACRELSDEAREIQKRARAVGAACTNARLKSQLLQAVETVPLLLSQMRITCAVKASASDEGSTDAAEQLSTTATNLSNTLRDLISYTQSAFQYTPETFKLESKAAPAAAPAATPTDTPTDTPAAAASE